MGISLDKFKLELQDALIDLAWRQWCALGVRGNATEIGNRCIDPEALILLTCTVGRCEPRLFDEMLDWLRAMQGYVSTQRLTALIRKANRTDVDVLRAVAGYLALTPGGIKWKSLAKRTGKAPVSQAFFFFKDGRPMESFGKTDPVFDEYGFQRAPVEPRGLVGSFDLTNPACLSIRLRSFLGLNSRSEICLYLVTHSEGTGATPSHISREIGYAQKAVQDALLSMSRSGFVTRRELKRDTLYSIVPSMRKAFLQGFKNEPMWQNWNPVFAFLLSVYSALRDPVFLTSSSMAQASDLRQIVERLVPQVEQSGQDLVFDSSARLQGDEFMAWTAQTTRHILKAMV